MSTYISNDIDDLETDKVNHPERPLPSGRIEATVAAILYFVFLGGSLVTTKYFVAADNSFYYYSLLLLAVNYNYIVDFLPSIKPFFVSLLCVAPILLLSLYLPEVDGLYLVAASAFLFLLGRELCMDYLDRSGDGETIVQNWSRRLLNSVALSIQTAALIFLCFLVETRTDFAALAFIITLTLLSARWWLNGRERRAMKLMKAQLLIGIYFLL